MIYSIYLSTYLSIYLSIHMYKMCIYTYMQVTSLRALPVGSPARLTRGQQHGAPVARPRTSGGLV